MKRAKIHSVPVAEITEAVARIRAMTQTYVAFVRIFQGEIVWSSQDFDFGEMVGVYTDGGTRLRRNQIRDDILETLK